MIAIVTKVLAPTDTRGKRVRAVSAGAHGLTRSHYGWDYAVDHGTNHERAAAAHAADRGLTVVASAPAPDGNGWVHVATEVAL